MRQSRLVLALVVLVAVPTFAQTTTPEFSGISEPPELAGVPKQVAKPSEADSELFEFVGHLTNEDETKSTLPKLDEFIEKHPDSRTPYFSAQPLKPAS